MPYRDRGQSPHKTLGRPTGRVKASAYHPAYHRPQNPMKTPSACLETAVLSSDGGRDGGRNRGRQPEREGVHHGVRQIAATGECGPMHGVIGRVRLLSRRSAHGSTPAGSEACYNFLYCIKRLRLDYASRRIADNYLGHALFPQTAPRPVADGGGQRAQPSWGGTHAEEHRTWRPHAHGHFSIHAQAFGPSFGRRESAIEESSAGLRPHLGLRGSDPERTRLSGH